MPSEIDDIFQRKPKKQLDQVQDKSNSVKEGKIKDIKGKKQEIPKEKQSKERESKEKQSKEKQSKEKQSKERESKEEKVEMNAAHEMEPVQEVDYSQTLVKPKEKRPTDEDGFGDSRGKRRKTDDGLPIYSEKELNIGQGGDTAECPFDCWCCY